MNINIEIGDVMLDGVDLRESQYLELKQFVAARMRDLYSSGACEPTKTQAAHVAATHASLANSTPRDVASGLAGAIGRSIQMSPGSERN